jgi:hypothetical protein
LESGEHTLQDVEADPSKTVDVRVVDLGKEPDLRRSHRVIFRQEKLETKNST